MSAIAPTTSTLSPRSNGFPLLPNTPSTSHSNNPNHHLNLGLHKACATGNIGLVQYALSNGQPTNSILFGFFPIHAAASGGSLTCLKLLLSHGADVNVINDSRDGDQDQVQFQDRSEANLNPNQTTLAQGSTPLHFASANNHLEIVNCLLQNGADPNITDREGLTPQSLAEAGGHSQIVGLLSSWNQGRRFQMPSGEFDGNGNGLMVGSGNDRFANEKMGSSPGFSSNQSRMNPTPTPPSTSSNFNFNFNRPRGNTESSSTSSSSSSPLNNSHPIPNQSPLKSQRSFEQLTSAASGVKNSLLNRRNMSLGKVNSNPNLKIGGGSSKDYSSSFIMPPFPGSEKSLNSNPNTGTSSPRSGMFSSNLLPVNSNLSGRTGSSSSSNSPVVRDLDSTGSNNRDREEFNFSTNQTSSPLQNSTNSTTSGNQIIQKEKEARRRPSLPSILEKAAHPAQSLRNALVERGVVNPSSHSSSSSTTTTTPNSTQDSSFPMNLGNSNEISQSPSNRFQTLPSSSNHYQHSNETITIQN